MTVHGTHCCNKHGCKYNDPDCPVVLGTEKGIICEDCESEIRDALEFREIVNQKYQSIHENILEYFDLWFTTSTLDGEFSSEQLRMIADAMDELKKIAKENGIRG